MVIEEWKDILGYEDYYQISNLGRVKSLERKVYRSDGKPYTAKEKIRATSFNKRGDKLVGLNMDGKKKTFAIHRLIALSFVANPNNYDEVYLINGDKSDHRLENLGWRTTQDRVIHNWRVDGRSKKHLHDNVGKKHRRSKKVIQKTMNNKFIKIWDCIRDVERELGIINISGCCLGRYGMKSSGGYKREYFNPNK